MADWEGIKRFGKLQARIYSEKLKGTARIAGDESSWTRKRDMPLGDMLACILGRKALSATMEIRQYFQMADKVEQTVSKQDYLKQRRKLNPEVFKVLNREYLRDYYETDEAKLWNGYLVLAVDGSRVEIPNSEENRKTYGESENQYGKAVARANFSGLYDVYNRFFLDIGIHHFTSSEKEEGKEHIKAIRQIVGNRPVLLIFDRNYVSLEFINYLEKAGVNYLIRLHKRNYKAEVDGMGSRDEWVELQHTKNRLRNLKEEALKRAAELELQGSTRARIVKARFGFDEDGALITNLPKSIGAEAIRRLYRKRWEIEKKYHTLKNKMKFESVTGKASIYVEQDFWAQALVFNMTHDLITIAERKAVKRAKKKGLRYEVRINENIAIGLFKEQCIRLILEEDNVKKDVMFRGLMADMEKNIVPVRESKSAHRKWNYFNKYKCNQKPSF
ncbi:IS4 family transposase [Treponema primitia]|uniref:IS4 family transposase n=1 Tax=Treponema primitia TaxID=88058 RepID=UPI0039805CD4